jgi:hypothetical protein
MDVVMRKIPPSAGIEHLSSSPELTQLPEPITHARRNTHIDRKAMSPDISQKDLNGLCLGIQLREEQEETKALYTLYIYSFENM